MKDYNEYMDRIKAPESLRRNVLARTLARPKRVGLAAPSSAGAVAPGARSRKAAVWRRGAAAACAIAVVLAMIYVPGLVGEKGVPLVPPVTPAASPGTSGEAIGGDRYALVWNKALEVPIYDKSNQIGVSEKELDEQEKQAVFPGWLPEYSLKGVARFDEAGSLLEVQASARIGDGVQAYIRIAPETAKPDYWIKGEPRQSAIGGVPIIAAWVEGEESDVYFAVFSLSDTVYYVEMSGGKAERAALPALLEAIMAGGPANTDALKPAMLAPVEETLSLSDARAIAGFGDYLPLSLPDGFRFEEALHRQDGERSAVRAVWSKGMDAIEWSVSHGGGGTEDRLVSVSELSRYELALYPIPRADSVPDELREAVSNPIFSIEELTLEAIERRDDKAASARDKGDVGGARLRFGVAYGDGDTIVEIRSKGVPPEVIYHMLRQLQR